MFHFKKIWIFYSYIPLCPLRKKLCVLCGDNIKKKRSFFDALGRRPGTPQVELHRG